MASIPVSYRMENVVNGTSISIAGKGKVSDSGLELDLRISDVPRAWSGAIVPCICSGPGPDPVEPETRAQRKGAFGGLRCPGLMSISKHGYETSPGTFRVASLFDDAGDMIAAVRAVGRYEKQKTGFKFAISVNTQTRANSIIGSLIRVDHYSFTVRPNGAGKVEVVAHYGLSAKNGRKAFGFTHIYYDLIDDASTIASPMVGCNAIDVDWSGTRLKYRTYQRTIPESSIGQFWSGAA